MAITVKHLKVSTIPDAGDDTLVEPSDWNADHTLTGTIPVANGGTGVATLTGYVKGNGTADMTASATIPNTDVTGLGTMSTQNANAVAITGGTMSGVTVTGYIPTSEKAQPLGVATLDASGKVPTSQIPMQGDLNYQGTWNASTNTPTLVSSTGTKGYYYVVDVAGSTNLNGITDWQVGDWAIFNGSVWQKVDNTDAVSSVNGQTGTVVLTTTNIAEGTNLYYTDARARASVSGGTGISYNSTTGVITNSSPSLGGDVVGPSSATDNAVARFDTTTGKLIQNSTTTIDDSGVLSTTKGLIGSGANLTDYPNAQVVSTQSKISGYGHNYRIGLVGEAQGNSSDTNQWGVGVYGKGWTNGDTRCAGLEGDAGVTNSADTGSATAIRAYSKSTHSGGLNVGVTIDVTGSSVHNYALYMQNGDLFSAAAQSWELVDGSNSALRFNATGKTGILDIITTNGAEGIATSGSLNVTGTSTLAGVSGNTITATTKFVSPYFDASSSAGGALRNASGTAQLQWGGGGGNNITFDVAANLNPANSQIDISPTGTGTVRINPATASSMNNVVIGATTPLAITGTTITATSFVGSGASLTNVVNSLTASTGISVSGSTGAVTVTNTAPDQTVAISSGTGISVSGTYPNFTVTNTAPSSGGTVTSVSGTAPIASSGGNTPAISISQATTSTDGYLSSTDWNTFNGKAAPFTYTSSYIPYGQGTTTPNQSASLTFASSTLTAPIVNASNGIVVNSNTVSASYTIPVGSSAMSAGPMTVASGQTVTVSSGSRWVVL
jgi:hypothetical protein